MENPNTWQRVNSCVEQFDKYIYNDNRDYDELINGKAVYQFILDADKLLYGGTYV
jgi:hypothetical protein